MDQDYRVVEPLERALEPVDLRRRDLTGVALVQPVLVPGTVESDQAEATHPGCVGERARNVPGLELSQRQRLVLVAGFRDVVVARDGEERRLEPGETSSNAA
jgi:hypothetical protein